MIQKLKKLPEGWEEIELSNKDYFEILSSGINKFEGEKDYLSTESVQGTEIEKVECKISYKDKPSRANMQPVLNSIWFAKMKDTLKVYCFDENNKEEIKKYILSTGFAGIKVDEKKVYPKYLKLFFTSKFFNEEKDKLCTGSTQKGINNNFIVKIKIPLPSLQIQEQIVSILEQAEFLKQKRKESDRLTREYLQGIFYEMFGDPKRNNKMWQTVTINDCINLSQYGTSTKSNNEDKGYIVFGMNCISEYGEMNLSKHNFVEISKEEFSKLRLDKGDIIFNRTNSPELVGKTTVWNYDLDAILASYLVKLKLKDNCNPFFFSFLLNTPYFKEMFFLSSKKAVNQANISPTLLKKFRIYLPPIELQKKFASIVEHVEKLKEKQNQSKEEIDKMFNSLMQKAFNGELAE
ncbi:MAG: restriction endonuclease subunit S [Candidatus Pacearchaeota archaeon]|nr:restriction endonuclease subunit S [Candidatus Pacearchaeota archaeon]